MARRGEPLEYSRAASQDLLGTPFRFGSKERDPLLYIRLEV